MSSVVETYYTGQIDVDSLPKDIARLALTVMDMLDAIKLPDGQYRGVGSIVSALNGIKLTEYPEFPGSPILKKRPNDLDVLVTTDLFRQLQADSQTPSGIPVEPRLFGRERSNNVLLITSDDLPGDMSIDIINGNDKRNPKKYDKMVMEERYELLGAHRIRTLGGHIRRLDSQTRDLRTIQDRLDIYRQVGI